MNGEIELSQVTDQLNSGILLLDLQLNIVSWNRFLAVHVNQKLEDVKGKLIFDVFPELPQRWFERKVASVIQLGTPTYCSWEQRHHLFELPHTRPITTDSHFMAQNCSFLPYEQEGKLVGICVLIEDVTDVCHYQSQLKETMKQLELANRIDGLTRIYNRKYWEEALGKEFARAQRYTSELSLIMFDLDHFKKLNDNYGHQCGDLVLIETASRVSSLLRDADVFGRYGGEEFGIVLPQTDQIGALEVAERVRAAISNSPIIFEGKKISFSASVGLATLNSEHKRYEDLISETDSALYRAKSSGRDQICILQKFNKCS
ncbi:diguanylate cyclase [Thalassotalea sp. M1531]|uniref:diguanylate cyclase n=1 Tax=Thalassotalea algicola TaxID=2716224 RepID=A0A7Y0LEE2_9GAMM|nr:diguanylate cyclase [Thalassotalea algicola]NMP32146.1 diguanylate cyclase [Thalassotalea algicola]